MTGKELILTQHFSVMLTLLCHSERSEESDREKGRMIGMIGKELILT